MIFNTFFISQGIWLYMHNYLDQHCFLFFIFNYLGWPLTVLSFSSLYKPTHGIPFLTHLHSWLLPISSTVLNILLITSHGSLQDIFRIWWLRSLNLRLEICPSFTSEVLDHVFSLFTVPFPSNQLCKYMTKWSFFIFLHFWIGSRCQKIRSQRRQPFRS
jgi:hypothetical protein